jgi:hypothetical protein
MSDSHDIISDIVQDRAPGTTDTVLNVTRGGYFLAEIEGNLDPFTIPESLGNDPRAKIRLHVTSAAQSAAISKNDLVQFSLFGQTITAEIVYQELDPASPQTKFIAAQILPKDAR